ncbi:hypothetical protein JCM3765_001508 [Sporobolomyces pararoseus]
MSLRQPNPAFGPARPYVPTKPVQELPQGYQGFLDQLEAITTTLDASKKWENGSLSPVEWKKHMQTEINPKTWIELLAQRKGRQSFENLSAALSKDLDRARQKILSGNFLEPNFPSMERYFLLGLEFPKGSPNVSKQNYKGRSLLHKLSLEYFCREMGAQEEALGTELRQNVQPHFSSAYLLNSKGQALYELRSAIEYDDEKDRYSNWTASISKTVEGEFSQQRSNEEARTSHQLRVVALTEVLAATVNEYGNKLNLKVLVGGILPNPSEFICICRGDITLASLNRSRTAQQASAIVSTPPPSSQHHPLPFQTRRSDTYPYASPPAPTTFSTASQQYLPVLPARLSPSPAHIPVARSSSTDGQAFPSSMTTSDSPLRSMAPPPESLQTPPHSRHGRIARPRPQASSDLNATLKQIFDLYQQSEYDRPQQQVKENLESLMKAVGQLPFDLSKREVSIYLRRLAKAKVDQLPDPKQIATTVLEAQQCNKYGPLSAKEGMDAGRRE